MGDNARSTPISQLPSRDDDETSTDASEVDHQVDHPPARKRRRTPSTIPRKSDRKWAEDDDDSGSVPAAHSAVPSMIRMFTSRAFLQAVVLAFVVILVVSATPLARMAVDRIPALSSVPQAENVINALTSAIAISALRPPAAGA
jgi:hypothetical protein